MIRRHAHFLSSVAVVGSFLAATACGPSAVDDGGDGSKGGSGAGNGAGAGPQIDVGGNTGNPSGGNESGRDPIYDENGNLICIRMAVLGDFSSAADNSSTDALDEWLNSNSGGSAVVTRVPAPAGQLSAEFLANYDLLLVANVNGMLFSDAEKQAVFDWVSSGAGGIITTTGFVSTASEAADTSQLLQPFGMGYSSVETSPSSGSQATTLNYTHTETGVTENVKDCLVNDAIITGAVPFSGATDEFAPLTESTAYVGAFHGFTVEPGTGQVIAMDPVSSTPIAAAQQLPEGGRVFAWGDEWVMLSSLWTGSRNDNWGGKCSVEGTPEGAPFSMPDLYQTKQFWYNIINWTAPKIAGCNFVIEDEDVVIPR